MSKLTNRASFIFAAAIVLTGAASVHAGTFRAPYASDGYTQTTFDIGITTADNITDMAFLPTDPNTLIFGSFNAGGIYAVHVTRDPNQHITGVTGAPTLYASTPGINGPIIFGPGNVLFYGQGTNVVEIKPGDTSPDKTVAISLPTGGSLAPQVSGLAFTPGNPSSLVLVSHGGELYTTTVASDGAGTYNITNLTPVQFIGEQAEDISFITVPQPDITPPAIILNAQVDLVIFNLDSTGKPTTFSDFYGPEPRAAGGVFDPTSGDYLFSALGQSTQLLEIRGFNAPEPASLALLGFSALALIRRRR